MADPATPSPLEGVVLSLRVLGAVAIGLPVLQSACSQTTPCLSPGAQRCWSPHLARCWRESGSPKAAGPLIDLPAEFLGQFVELGAGAQCFQLGIVPGLFRSVALFERFPQALESVGLLAGDGV